MATSGLQQWAESKGNKIRMFRDFDIKKKWKRKKEAIRKKNIKMHIKSGKKAEKREKRKRVEDSVLE